jgi:molybdopterin converting factor small subunit
MWIIERFDRRDSRAPGAMPLKIKFYGALGEKIGREVELDLPPAINTVAQLRSLLSDQYPAATIELLGRTRACVAETVVSEEYCLTNRDMVEFFPPLSGG